MIFRTLSDRTTVARHGQLDCYVTSTGYGRLQKPGLVKERGQRVVGFAGTTYEAVFLGRTFIFTDVFESKSAIGVFAFDNADLAKGAFTDNAE
jgi:hypothetical protein